MQLRMLLVPRGLLRTVSCQRAWDPLQHDLDELVPAIRVVALQVHAQRADVRHHGPHRGVRSLRHLSPVRA